MNLQPVKIFADFPFYHVRSYALKKTVDTFEDSRDDALGLNQPLQLVSALKYEVKNVNNSKAENDGQKVYIVLCIHTLLLKQKTRLRMNKIPKISLPVNDSFALIKLEDLYLTYSVVMMLLTWSIMEAKKSIVMNSSSPLGMLRGLKLKASSLTGMKNTLS